MVEHKKQHYIPQSYLAAWCDPETPSEQEPYVWWCLKDGSACKKKAPQNIFYEAEMYTLHTPDGKRDLRLEHGLSGLEGWFVTIRSEKLDSRAKLDTTEHLRLLAFMAGDARPNPETKRPLEGAMAKHG